MAQTFDDYLRGLFHIESGGDPNARTGSNRGLGQFGPAEERQFGITDANRTDPAAQARAVAAEYARNHSILSNALGREPTFAEHYLTHQQGQAGGPALLTGDPNAPAWQTIRKFYPSDRVAQSAIMGNIPSDSPLKRMDVNQISNGAFTGLWADKFNRFAGGGGGTATPPPDVAASTPLPTGGAVSPMAGLLAKLGIGSASAASPMVPAAGPTPSGATLDAVAATQQQGENQGKPGDARAKALGALAQQLMIAGQAPKANFMQLQSMNTGPVRALPIDLPPMPKGFGTTFGNG
jgi:hypothetical protein